MDEVCSYLLNLLTIILQLNFDKKLNIFHSSIDEWMDGWMKHIFLLQMFYNLGQCENKND